MEPDPDAKPISLAEAAWACAVAIFVVIVLAHAAM